jgi:hypothetical protein
MTQPKVILSQVDISTTPDPIPTGAFQIPVGTTAQRPSTPAVGMTRYNSTLGVPEIYKSASWYESPTILKGSTTFDFASIASNSSATTTITVTGAAVGDPVALGRPTPTGTGAVTELTFEAFVSAVNTVTLNVVNATTGAADLDSATYNVVVFKF